MHRFIQRMGWGKSHTQARWVSRVQGGTWHLSAPGGRLSAHTQARWVSQGRARRGGPGLYSGARVGGGKWSASNFPRTGRRSWAPGGAPAAPIQPRRNPAFRKSFRPLERGLSAQPGGAHIQINKVETFKVAQILRDKSLSAALCASLWAGPQHSNSLAHTLGNVWSGVSY